MTTQTEIESPDEQAELAALRVRRAELQAEREKLEGINRLEQERQALADDEAINAAIAKHGPRGRGIEVVHTDFGVVIVKRCTAMKYKKFQDEGDFSTIATEALVETQVVYPDKPVYRSWIEEQPMIATRCANALSRLAGVRKDDVKKE